MIFLFDLIFKLGLSAFLRRLGHQGAVLRRLGHSNHAILIKPEVTSQFKKLAKIQFLKFGNT